MECDATSWISRKDCKDTGKCVQGHIQCSEGGWRYIRLTPLQSHMGSSGFVRMVVLGVTLTDTLSFRPHIDHIVARTSQTSFALCLLRSHGLGAPQLFDVARAMLVAQLTYASPAWAGFINC